ncbi:transmembrane channel-like protein 7 [Caerostris extrusa]|uniref:Transmembrane channel-like protein 7 n=1 Tax=Caerostris extrusa TaxID=172846 RepID=A0AAV4XS52_CAEEX|nr:transmembrane channel-like protein 7 [Caerostris extrusa]
MNVLVLLWIAGCYVLIYHVAFYQLTEQKKQKLEEAGFRTLVIQYLPSLTVMSISIVSPVFFSFLISFEKYHAQTEVNVSLIRNAFLSLSSVIVLVNAFHQEVTCEPKDICGAGKALIAIHLDAGKHILGKIQRNTTPTTVLSNVTFNEDLKVRNLSNTKNTRVAASVVSRDHQQNFSSGIGYLHRRKQI